MVNIISGDRYPVANLVHRIQHEYLKEEILHIEVGVSDGAKSKSTVIEWVNFKNILSNIVHRLEQAQHEIRFVTEMKIQFSSSKDYPIYTVIVHSDNILPTAITFMMDHALYTAYYTSGVELTYFRPSVSSAKKILQDFCQNTTRKYYAS